ncbi:intradiol ring-cleavage dioxygenase [Usitatibacter palustris]|uniref:Intradiol ring-cleavage dioxygenases domain-containing protein n=1 Tax=Usitatibacter palustris TaxID=2732487 RepID=A0A6M4H8G2_9PROT|nr:intradiol ring-cleavage dioxygenase [Usitatibacter palustris]QJR15455.1 hypothetical protein DSM104440_02276 [Usitatibacter palustris]
MTDRPERRRVLKALGIAAAWPLVAAPAVAAETYRPATPKLTAGPQYPKIFPTDSDWDMTRVAGRDNPATGVVTDITGTVMNRKSQPQAGLRLEFWQSDADGIYLNTGATGGDANFQGFAAVTTDADGRYKLRTIKPVPYPGRTAHIHFLVKDDGKEVLASEMFVYGMPGNDGDGLYRSLGANAELVTVKLTDAPKDSGAKLRGTFDIVIPRKD